MTVESAPRSPSLPELFEAFGEALRRSVRVALPGRVERYYPGTNSADIKPLVKDRVPTADGSELLEELPVIPAVPIVFPRAGGYFLSLPVARGDLVTLIFADRSLDAWKSGRGVDTDPDDFRAHDLTDAVAILGGYPLGRPVDEGGVAAHAVLGKEGGAQVHVKPDQVSLYEENAADFVALAQKVLDELNLVKSDFETLLLAVNGHSHAALGAPPSPLIVFTPHTPASVAASKVKAT